MSRGMICVLRIRFLYLIFTSLADLPPLTKAVHEDCFTGNGADYKGRVNVTLSGHACLRWDEANQDNNFIVFPKLRSQENFCRNPDGSERPWCYSILTSEWEYCNVKRCDSSVETDCTLTTFGSEYLGTKNTTISGRLCMAWKSHSPHKHRFSDVLGNSENFCRNPDMESEGPWCYTQDEEKKWEHCGIPKCNITNANCYHRGRAQFYSGKINVTLSNSACRRWDSEPAYQNFKEHQNYCRALDGAEFPWCFSENRENRWERCDIPICEEMMRVVPLCREGWRHFKNGTCYKVFKETVTWFEADQSCRLVNSTLGSILDIDEQHLVYGLIGGDLCFDVHNETECKILAGKSKCTTDPMFMYRNCRKTCNICNINCHEDLDEEFCADWRSLEPYACKNNTQSKLELCPKLCGTCLEVLRAQLWIGLSGMYAYKPNNPSGIDPKGKTIYNNLNKTLIDAHPDRKQSDLKLAISLANGQWYTRESDVVLAGYVCKTKPTVDAAIGNHINTCNKDYNGKCYIYVKRRLNWITSERFCRKHFHGHLAGIYDKFVQWFLATDQPEKFKNYWIGLGNVRHGNMPKKWTNGDQVQFVLWNEKNKKGSLTPSLESPNKTCVLMQRNGTWIMQSCNERNFFICEKRHSVENTHVQSSSLDHPSWHGGPSFDLNQDLQGCGINWALYGNHCYKILDKESDWQDGRSICQSTGGELASIHNSSHLEYIRKLINSERSFSDLTWIGIAGSLNNGSTWSDGSKVIYTNFSNGVTTQMDNGTCVAVDRRGAFRWKTCGNMLAVLCKRKRKVECGSPPVVPNASIVRPGHKYHPGSVAFYYCNQGYVAVKGNLFVLCQSTLLWSKANFTCYENCYRPGTPYYGDHDVTISGKTCQDWSSNYPHQHRYASWPNAIDNFCRDYDHDKPWCYTTHDQTRWENCDVPRCQIDITTTSVITSLKPTNETDEGGLSSRHIKTGYKDVRDSNRIFPAVVGFGVLGLLLMCCLILISIYIIKKLRKKNSQSPQPTENGDTIYMVDNCSIATGMSTTALCPLEDTRT